MREIDRASVKCYCLGNLRYGNFYCFCCFSVHLNCFEIQNVRKQTYKKDLGYSRKKNLSGIKRGEKNVKKGSYYSCPGRKDHDTNWMMEATDISRCKQTQGAR